jgi:glycosyltransferase involved in cell wall biosynthesis
MMSASATPRVSVGIPVFNGEPFITETLDSVVGQTFEDLEIIISDNASTDRTESICQEYAQKDGRIRYLRNRENIGLAKNFQRVVQLARGEYFKLANADDLCGPDLVSQCVQVLDRDPTIVLCYGKTTLIDGQGRTLREHEDRLDLRSPSVTERFRLALERIGLTNVLQGVMRTGALQQTALLDTYVGADMVLVVELALRGRFHELPTRLFQRRIHAGAFSSQASEEGQLGTWEPGARRSTELYFWRHYRGYLRAISRAPLPVPTKLRLAGVVMKRAITARGVLAHELFNSVRRS